MNNLRRYYVIKKEKFQTEGKHILSTINKQLGIASAKDVKVVSIYDVRGLEDSDEKVVINEILHEPNVDDVYCESLKLDERSWGFVIEPLPGQYDQRADSAKECIAIVTLKDGIDVKSSKGLIIEGRLTEDDKSLIKRRYINPVESREGSLIKSELWIDESNNIEDIEVYTTFTKKSEKELANFRTEHGLAMTLKDLLLVRDYFKSEDRNPTETEIKVLDTYWSDHCRHTTFMTELTNVSFDEDVRTRPIRDAYERYLAERESINRRKPVCLMDMGTIQTRVMKDRNLLNDFDESEEINACSIHVKADVTTGHEDYLLMFKNETHNHPTEIEPFGGAATCLGGAIRDPLSGRAYVYQGMRITGAADPRVAMSETLKGKLPQMTITQEAAHGFSSYGNQIGLATGFVREHYHEGFMAKRMEVGAVIAAAPRENVIRLRPEAGDVVLLIGGRTGRDGCGGATGSSKAHDEGSLLQCGAEVQKGNPPQERKIQRLFRNPEMAKLIKRCNDFGAGGVSVAIGELADSLTIDLDKVPVKYVGLTGTEVAISESQERMAIVVNQSSVSTVEAFCKEENVEVSKVADVTDTGRLIMHYQGKTIVDMSRDFIETSGAKNEQNVHVEATDPTLFFAEKDVDNLKEAIKEELSDINKCLQKGLVERFDHTIGANTVLMPFGGKHQLTPSQGMVAKLPALHENMKTVSIMTSGYDPKLAFSSPFHGGYYATLDAIARIVALGGSPDGIRMSLQEYFERLNQDANKWGKPMSAILGSNLVQSAFAAPAIGGKDSMSGTFNDIHVPPTLIAFGVQTASVDDIISQELKSAGSYLYLAKASMTNEHLVDLTEVQGMYRSIHEYMNKRVITSAYALGQDNLYTALVKMGLGNGLGVKLEGEVELGFQQSYGSLVIESKLPLDDFQYIGRVVPNESITIGQEEITYASLVEEYKTALDSVFPRTVEAVETEVKTINYNDKHINIASKNYDKPKVLIPVFPGTNCEYDTQLAVEKAGGQGEIFVFNNQSINALKASIKSFAGQLKSAQILALPGGFSAGDEPDGSGKFMASILRNPEITEEIMELLYQRDGLMIGICNGFQALVKLGLLPFGEIRTLTDESPTLTHNDIGRHISALHNVRVSSLKSPWMSSFKTGDVYKTAFSHGEGKFVAPKHVIEQLVKNGQVATQYSTESGEATMDPKHNPNGSYCAIEGLLSADGRIIGKMGHVERSGYGLYKNIAGETEMPIFKNGIEYFKG